MVIEAATLAADSLEIFIENLQKEAESNDYLNNLKQEEHKEDLIREKLLPQDYNYIVTPKEIDELIQNMSNIVARGINMSL